MSETPGAQIPTEAPPQKPETLLGTTPKEPTAPPEAPKAPEPPAPEAPPAGDQGTAKPGEKDPTPPEKPPVPEKYELKLPQGSLITSERLEKLSAFAKEKGLSQDQAQMLVEREHDAVNEYHARLHSNYAAEEKKWIETAQKDSEIGGDNLPRAVEYSKRVLERFASEQLRKELDESRLGNHPELVRLLYRIGKKFHPKELVMPSQHDSSRPGTIEERFYGPQK